MLQYIKPYRIYAVMTIAFMIGEPADKNGGGCFLLCIFALQRYFCPGAGSGYQRT